MSRLALVFMALPFLIALISPANAGVDDALHEQQTEQRKQVDRIVSLKKPLIECVRKQAHTYELYSSPEKADVAARAAVGLCSKEEGAYRSALFQLAIIVTDFDAADQAQEAHRQLVEMALTIIVEARQHHLVLPAPRSSLANEKDWFVEFPEAPAKTRTYDLRTVQIIQPGRFTIVSTSIDDPDVMRFELSAIHALEASCKRPDGNYQPPADIFTIGPPDLPIKNIEVKSSEAKVAGKIRQSKSATWSYPYKRLALEDHGEFSQESAYFVCKDGMRSSVDETTLYAEQERSITNGRQTKTLFDCKRGLYGDFVTLDQVPGETERFWPPDPEKVSMFAVKPFSFMDSWYQGICLRVLHEKPYSPE